MPSAHWRHAEGKRDRMSDLPVMMPALPEIFLAAASMVLMMVGAFSPEKRAFRTVMLLALAMLVAAAVLVLIPGRGTQDAFNGLFRVDDFAVYMKILVLAGSFLAIVMSLGFVQREGMARFELPILIIFATLGMMMMISANDLIALYIGLELKSLSLYVVAAFKRDTVRSTEAGLKYFVLGALSSGMLLYGCSMIYGFTGTTQFAVLADRFISLETVPVGLVVGLVFLAAGLAFKISAVPFHMWTPDVYEGAPTPITAFFSIAPKIAAMALFVRVMIGPFGELIDEWRQIVVVVSVLSMVLGALAAISQTNIKRLMAYSSIGHVGYALVGLAAGTEEGIKGVIIYLTIYLAMNVGTFGCILSMRVQGRMVEQISDLGGLAKTNPRMAAALLLFMFSLAGIPPLAGFFGKWFVFAAAINAGLVTLAVIGVLASVVGAFYYLRIVKVMYFDEAVEPFDKPDRSMAVVLSASAIVVTVLFLVLSPVDTTAALAATALFAN